MRRFFHIGVNYAGSPVRPEVIDTALGPLVADWMRYSPCCWIIWTDATAESVFQGLKHCITLSDSILITRIDPEDRAGYLPKWAWDWIDSKRGALPDIYPPPHQGVPLNRLGGGGIGESPMGGILGTYGDLPEQTKPMGLGDLLSALGSYKVPEKK